MDNVITRFAPSPTGYIHFGNIRTALFCWLFAKKNKGKFLLRIDDTDKERSHRKYVNNILDVLKWLDLDYDSLYFQSNRFDIYKFYLDLLIKNGKAYKCYCSKDRLDFLKKNQFLSKSKITYDGHCKNISSSSNKFVIRFIVDKNCATEFNDIVKGKIKISNDELDDFIISKNNYLATYNFASVIDDIEFGITDIIRGEDHISNTQKQILIFNSLNKLIPNFAHLPMILDSEKKKISKRTSLIYMNYYIERGFLPIAILNYLIRLGWSYKNFEIFSFKEMIQYFDINNVGNSSSSLDQSKLFYLNKYYMQNLSSRDLYFYSMPILKKFNFNFFNGPKILDLLYFNKNRFNTLYDLFKECFYFYSFNLDYDNLNLLSFDSLLFIKKFYFDLKKSFYFWNVFNIKSHIDYFIKENNLFFFNFVSSLRFIIVGSNSSYPIYNLIFLSGKILLLKKIINTLRRVGL